MRRLVLIMFAVSDWLSWLLVLTGVLGAIAVPFAMPAYDRMSGQPVSVAWVFALSAVLLLVAGGAFALLKRKPFGLLLLMVPAPLLVVVGGYLAAAIVAAIVLLLFAGPYSLMFLLGPKSDRPVSEA